MEELCVSHLTAAPVEKETVNYNPRIAQYKATNNASSQEERRRKLLQDQKKKRDESFNANRGLIEEIETLAKDEEAMDVSFVKAKPRVQNAYKNRLMLSEWLENVPEDLEDLWYLVPCPIGRRSLVIASGGKTYSYSRHGYHTATFRSCLPGGNRDDTRGTTILDCIWSFSNYTYYVLDVLAWSNQPMLDCETEFRFYWLKSKLEETPNLSEKTNDNAHPFILLPYYPCFPSAMAKVMATENLFGEEGPHLDGLLFYHSQTHYLPGRTPLVGWLKPRMMASKLGIPVANIHLVEDMESERRKKHKNSCKHHRKMQVEEENTDESKTEMEISGLEDTDDSQNSSCNGEMESKECCNDYIDYVEPQEHEEILG